MKVAVWDTYVNRKDGLLMHFDILVPVELQTDSKVLEFVNQYLEHIGLETKEVNIRKCEFCHIERATDETIQIINEKGFDIIEFENCT